MLVATAIDLLNESGVASFSLREVARRAEVAAAAPSHHFGNVAGLLTAVATTGFEQLASAFEDVLSQGASPVEQVLGLCEAYVSHGRRHPGVASVMFRNELLNQGDPDFLEARPRSLQLLQYAVRSALEESTGTQVSHGQASRVAKVVWATMHGLVTLRMAEGEALRAQVGFAARAVLAGAVAAGPPP
ncbi:MAG: TetR-like C-terminal domain-containing protein [Bacteroidota bacterium]